ncbi:hypothetical protein L218DRAFT_1007749 [Marasmius fiardii PR-910]|nr:hypothetical protein L218DRAFT_1007749 [Marasmius fiardii PR-910]
MSVNPIELTLSHALNGSGNPVHTHGPFPIMSYGANSVTDTGPQTNSGMCFSGENLGNNYTSTPSLFSVPINGPNHSVSSPTSGTWLANLKLAILTHKHADGTPCSNVLEHAAIADSEEDKSFSAAHTRLVQHILAPERQHCMKLEAENTDLLATVRDLRNQLRRRGDELDARHNSRSSIVGNKRKMESNDSPNRRPTPPNPPTATGSRDRDHFPIPPSYVNLGSEPYPGRQTATLLYQHANYRPGFNSAGVLATWNVSGWLDVPSYITKHASLRTLPEIISFSGNACGSQLLPANDAELSALVSQSNEPGNFRALFRLRDSMGLGLILEGLNRELCISTTPIPSIIPKLLRTSPTPYWSSFTRYIDVNDVKMDTDAADHWNSSPCIIPTVRTPNSRTSDEDYALFTWVHYDNLGHLGIILTDDGHIQLDSVRGHRILSSITPARCTGIHEFRREFVRLVSWPGLYSSILKNKGISVNPSGHISRCPTELSRDVEGIARHLANCNVTETTVNHLFHWGMQYCLDVQDLLSIPESHRHELATIYKYGRIRSLFFPIHTDHLSDTYIKPSHINPYQVMEYRRRQFVHARWKDTNSLPSPDFKVLVHHVPRASPSAIPVSVAGLSLSETGNTTLPPSSTSGVLPGSTSATSSETPTSETSNMQSVSATASSVSLAAKTDNLDVDMQENSDNCATNIDAMEDVE